MRYSVNTTPAVSVRSGTLRLPIIEKAGGDCSWFGFENHNLP
jgi:hypothetical protein